MTAKTKLKTVHLSKSYGSVVALADAALDVQEGEFVTLLGPSGSGKTTLLMMVAGLVQPSGGEVWIDGKLSTYLPPHLRDIGMVFQNYALFPHLSVAENIAFPLRMRRMAEAAIGQEVERILELVQLPAVARRLPRELSGGQQQRIALARCLVYKPSIVLMDEPLGALDKKLRDQMQLEIKALQRRLGITVVYVTHDQEEAMTMSDRICLMNHARIEQIDTPEKLYFRPCSVFAADFLGDSNIFKVRVDGAGRLEGPGALVVTGTGGSAAASVTVIIRPESIRLLTAGETAEGTATGRIENVVFVGGFMRLFVRLADGTVLQAKGATAPGLRLPPQGEEVRLGWPAAATVLIPAGAAP